MATMPSKQAQKPAQAQNALAKAATPTLKDCLLGNNAIATFRDYLPTANAEHAEQAAKRFAKLIYVAVMQNADLQKCTPASIIKASSLSASLNLDIDQRGFAYLVPYKNEATLQIGYLGLMELAFRSSKVKAFDAYVIRESEKINVKIVRLDGQFSVDHPFSYEKPTGNIIAAYATAQVEGYGPKTIVLRIDEIESFRARSKCPNSPAWKNDYEAMCKKTVIRQLTKFLPKSAVGEDLARAAAIDEKESFEESSTKAGNIIDADAGSRITDTAFDEPTPIQADGDSDIPDFMKID